jgi:C1A family cysteine protease
MNTKNFLLGIILFLLPLHAASRQHRTLQTALLTPSDEAESSYRDLIEARNMEYIEQHNRGKSTFKMAANQFLSLTHEEFAATVGSPINFPHQEALPSLSASIPLTANIIIDWWKAGKVSPVKDQGDYCGSCYAFATTSDI